MEAKKLKQLLKKLEKEPNNLDLINKVAIGYLWNCKMCQNNEDYEYFKKAYNLKKTIKSTHNYADYLFNENYNYKEAYSVQKKCIAMNPKSHYPYLLYAHIHIELKKYPEAIELLEKVQNITYSWHAEHNLGYCKYMLRDYKGAKKHFLVTYQDKQTDIELISHFGLILANYKLNNKKGVYKLLAEMQNSPNYENALNNYDIGAIYFLYDDYENSKNNTLKAGLNIDLMDWKELGYSIFMADKELFYGKINKYLSDYKKNIEIINANKDNWANASDIEKQKRISDIKKMIKTIENIEEIFKNKSDTDIDGKLDAVNIGCTVFGCYIDEKSGNE